MKSRERSVTCCSAFNPSAVWWQWLSRPFGRSCVPRMQARSLPHSTSWWWMARYADFTRWMPVWSWTLLHQAETCWTRLSLVFHGLICVQLFSATSQAAKGGSPWLSVSREEGSWFHLQHCGMPTITHTIATNQSQWKIVLAKDAMLWRYCFCMTTSQANHCTCHACVIIHTCCQTHFVSVGARGGRASMHKDGYDARGNCVAAVNRGELGDLLSMEHRQSKSVWVVLPENF